LLIIVVLLIATALAEPAMTAPSSGYSAAVPTMKSILGYDMGEQFTPYSEVERYFKTLAAATDRIKLDPYGKTYEGRTLYTVVISSPKNLARLNAIREADAKLADPRKTTAQEAQKIASEMPVVLWYGYNVHGNEAASSEAAMQVAYELAASQDERVQKWLENAVIVMDPMANPDGRDRYVAGYRQTMGVRPRGDRFAAEHQERWPGGRVNHYLFDLNRDWAWLSQVESSQRIARYLQWNPQVDVDFHEMGPSSTYFFFPPAKPVLPWIEPLLNKWFEIYGKANATAFDKFGIRYFTKESFDFFYPSYGDIWPALNGAIGMTYEQGGGGAGGLTIDLPEGQRTLTLRDRAAHHFITSLSTLVASVQNRQARLQDFYEFHRAAIQGGQQSAFRAVYIVPGRDPYRATHVVETLMKQGVEVKQASTPIEAEDLTSYWGEKSAKKRLPAGTYVVDMAQPAGFLARALLQRDIEHSENLFFYDVSGWALPLAADVEAYSSGKLAAASLSPVKDASRPPRQVREVPNAAAYVFTSDSLGSIRMLGHLLDQDLKAYVSIKPFKLNGREYSAGSIIVPAETNPPDLAQRIGRLQVEDEVEVAASPTTMVDEGFDLGSNRVRFVRKPRVAVLMDTPTSANDYGALWYLFEQRLDLPFTPLRAENLRDVDLTNYNVLILPADYGDGRGYSRYLDKPAAAKIGDWVRAGGVLIGIRGGAIWATKAKSGLTSVTYRFVRPDDEQGRIDEEKASAAASGPTGSAALSGSAGSSASPVMPGSPNPAEAEKKKQAELEKKLIKYADREKQQRSEEVPGAILRVNLDNTHPLAFGLGEQMPVLNDTAPILELTSKGENVAYFPKENLQLSGFISAENERKVAQSAFLIREHAGRGAVVLFADNPVFRGFWDGTTRLLLNAIFFGNITDPNAQ
jgi:hypothetical protein